MINVKTFRWAEDRPSNFVKAERVETPEMRLYRTPEGNLYPSVTTVLGAQPKPELDAWRAAVGEEEANRVSEHAARRGTNLHNMAEDYLNNRFDPKTTNPMILQDFLPIKRVLDEHVNNVFSTELQMWSDRIRSAGTTDLIADYDSIRSLIDFKTSRKIKYESDIESYFIQEGAYCCMVAERFGFWIENIVTIMMVDGDSEALIFKKKSIDYVGKYIKIREDFRRKYDI